MRRSEKFVPVVEFHSLISGDISSQANLNVTGRSSPGTVETRKISNESQSGRERDIRHAIPSAWTKK